MAMGYGLVRTLARSVLGLFHRRIDLVGPREHSGIRVAYRGNVARGRSRGGRELRYAPREPVGVVFHEPGTFRPGRALLRTSGAVASADRIALYAIAPDGARRVAVPGALRVEPYRARPSCRRL